MRPCSACSVGVSGVLDGIGMVAVGDVSVVAGLISLWLSGCERWWLL